MVAGCLKTKGVRLRYG